MLYEVITVFVNLLTNSIQSLHIKSQFSKDFKPKIEIKSYIDTSVIINLTDNGIGLEQHQTTKIFTPFYTTKKAVGGTGLGLFIVSDLFVITSYSIHYTKLYDLMPPFKPLCSFLQS